MIKSQEGIKNSDFDQQDDIWHKIKNTSNEVIRERKQEKEGTPIKQKEEGSIFRKWMEHQSL